MNFLKKKVIVFFSVIILALTISCETENKKIELENSQILLKSNPNLESEIIGEWEISMELFDDRATICFACPSVTFNENGTASLVYPSDEKEFYNWEINRERLAITHNGFGKGEEYFEDLEFNVEIKYENEFVEVKMFGVNGIGYVLRKEKLIPTTY